ncbi:MAG: glycoside hydrolase family 127 protein [Lachnospiraceae bacterium]
MKFEPLDLTEYRMNDSFWNTYISKIRTVVIPYQWDILNDLRESSEPSHSIQNFKIAAKQMEGQYYGQVFQDSDVYKWLEAVGNMLKLYPDPTLEEKADYVIDLIGAAQEDDGYLNTYFTLEEPDKKWTNLLECHELYCAGHFIEAAVTYTQATGKKKILMIAEKLADHIAQKFGPQENQLHGYPGHQEIELALLRLYDQTGKKSYLDLAEYFLMTRGTNSFFEEEFIKRKKISFWSKHKVNDPNQHYNQYPYSYYNQFHLPVIKQPKAVGHAVRAVYMYAAMADLAAKNKNKELYEVCLRLWNNITEKQLYITGGIGSTPSGEAFTRDYDLPNDTNYSETCASIGLIFFARYLLLNKADRRFADIMERALYNTVLAGMSQSGDHFFYVNPLEVVPEWNAANPERHHIKSTRAEWFACACCPPNIARLLSSLWEYVYTKSSDQLYFHLYASGEGNVAFEDGSFQISVQTEYPWKNRISITAASACRSKKSLAIRIPEWCSQWRAAVVRHVSTAPARQADLYQNEHVTDGYWFLDVEPDEELHIELTLDMSPRILYSNPNIHYNGGRVAVMRGPLVYCIEEVDNGSHLHQIALDTSSLEEINAKIDNLGDCVVLKAHGVRELWENEDVSSLYRTKAPVKQPIELTLIPYFLWDNRGEGEMMVWMRTV